LTLTWLASLYTPARDVTRALVNLRSHGLIFNVEANALGPRTWVIVTAQCRGGGKPVVVRGCHAQLYESVFDACSGPQPVPTHVIQFRPGGLVTIAPGQVPVRWEVHVLNDHIRRVARERDDAATITAYGDSRGQEALALRDSYERELEARRKRHALLAILALFFGTAPPRVTMRIVVESIQGKNLMTTDVDIPPMSPLSDRIELFIGYLTQRRLRNAGKRIKNSDQ
jgi:hypothetical protein